MTPNERKKADIASIKPRTFALELSDADIKNLYALAYGHGTTPEEILTGFISDLIGGTYTHGSDERDFAQRYFDRCLYGFGLEKNFLQWALYEYRLDDIAGLLEDIEEAESDLAYYEDCPEEAADDPDGVQAVRDAKEYAEKELADLYQEYKDGEKNPQSFPDGIDAIKKYLAEVQAITERGQLDE